MTVNDQAWEDICSPHSGDYLERVKVPGGWIYRTQLFGGENENQFIAIAMVFVPDQGEKE
jgi:hypothetical protein